MQNEKVPYGVETLKNGPVIALVKYENGFIAYPLEQGLTTLVTNPSQQFQTLRTTLVEKNLNTGFVFHPVTLTEENQELQQIRQQPIVKFEIPENFKVLEAAKFGVHDVPLIVFYQHGELQQQQIFRNYQNLQQQQEIEFQGLFQQQ